MAILIVRSQQDDINPGVWHAKITGPHSVTGINHLADITVNEQPETWLANHPGEAQAAIDAGVIDDVFNSGLDFRALADDVQTQIAWLAINIPQVDTADLATLRSYLKREMQIMQAVLKALRYIFKRTV